MKYIYTCVLVLLVTSGCSSRQQENSYTVSSLAAYSYSYPTTEQPLCKTMLSISGGLSGKCAAAVAPLPVPAPAPQPISFTTQPMPATSQTFANVAPTGTPR